MEETTIQTSYTVRTGSFEGPLELLLNLVEARKLFINEISLAQVTDDFLSQYRLLPKENLSELTSFLSVAATLMLIKSRSLLPGFLVTKEEEEDIKDLERRLALYALVRGIGEELSEKYGKTTIRLPQEREVVSSVFAPDTTLTLEALHASVIDVLNKVPKTEVLPEVRVRKIVSIEEMLTGITERVAGAIKVSFKEWQKTLPGGTREEVKGNIIVSFLAMLELVRQGLMDALQNEAFEDIELSKVESQDI